VKKNLVLLGMMAVGKTTLGKIVAKIQGLEFIDIDTNIEKKNSMSINEIFNKKGEKFFRTEEEKEALNSLKKKNCVIALGGGAFVNEIIRANVLKNAISVWLDIDIDILNKRVKWSQKRPLLKEENSKKILKKLYEKRKEFYKQANYKIACNKLNKQDVIKKIVTLYAKQ
jgi:shikimate kinase|tara:strand:- start:136 stop:645 length:510 start_codon:yes stop_codon:yes gene_type:complete